MRFRRATQPAASYELQTYGSPYWIVRFPHRRRFENAVERIRNSDARTLLDYGTGDAHLMLALADAGALPDSTIGFEPDERLARLAEDSMRDRGIDDRVRIVRSLEECGGSQFDFISCLGVLEHLPLGQREEFYGLCEAYLAPKGVGLIDVPVEIGPSVLVKEAVRWTLKGGWNEYRLGQLLRQASGARVRDPRRFDPDPEVGWIGPHGHFDHRNIVDEVRTRFRLLEIFGSPFKRLPAALGNQEVFIAFDPGRP